MEKTSETNIKDDKTKFVFTTVKRVEAEMLLVEGGETGGKCLHRKRAS